MSKQCPVCSWNKSYRWWNRHMVSVHGWRYYNVKANGNIAEPPNSEPRREPAEKE